MEQPEFDKSPPLLMAIMRDGDDLMITFYGESDNGELPAVCRSFSYEAAVGFATAIIQAAGRSFEKPTGPVIVLEDLE